MFILFFCFACFWLFEAWACVNLLLVHPREMSVKASFLMMYESRMITLNRKWWCKNDWTCHFSFHSCKGHRIGVQKPFLITQGWSYRPHHFYRWPHHYKRKGLHCEVGKWKAFCRSRRFGPLHRTKSTNGSFGRLKELKYAFRPTTRRSNEKSFRITTEVRV